MKGGDLGMVTYYNPTTLKAEAGLQARGHSVQKIHKDITHVHLLPFQQQVAFGPYYAQQQWFRPNVIHEAKCSISREMVELLFQLFPVKEMP